MYPSDPIYCITIWGPNTIYSLYLSQFYEYPAIKEPSKTKRPKTFDKFHPKAILHPPWIQILSVKLLGVSNQFNKLRTSVESKTTHMPWPEHHHPFQLFKTRKMAMQTCRKFQKRHTTSWNFGNSAHHNNQNMGEALGNGMQKKPTAGSLALYRQN